MVTTDVPTHEELVERAAGAAKAARDQVAWSEENRRLADGQIEALADAGVFKLRTPVRYGGYEAGTRTLVRVAAELGAADGSLGWTAQVYWIPTWMAGMFPDEVQDEVFATPDVRVCGTLSPSGMATEVDGGIVVNGKWGFITGAHHAHWQEIIAVVLSANAEPQPVMALVPMSDLTVIDDWDTHGLRGTGSVSTAATDLFVPAARVMPLGAVLNGQPASAHSAERPMYRAPLVPVASASSVGVTLGLARAARDAFYGRLPDRKITYTGYDRQDEAPVTHLQAAHAAQLADEAEFHVERLASLVDGKAATGAEWTVADRVSARAELGAACRRARETVEVYARASGGSSIYRDVPLGRILSDVQSINLHALMNPDTNAELHGRILAGQQPDSLYI
ncbi:acyl-CoA dehydrogenase family protein [Actinomadura harenae]|uniref:Acyl-CoA dehydrogenase n=1 Tax=Actinomadura harenae TaxID=2483351 RepID=A0A3M2LTC1_9ACTN|nr:acyl-CoA dehydrogenase family protein [Actinomadura harenae]RMI40731.1 acyl-CoA dehydrogenase [Actinomadura harenae]